MACIIIFTIFGGSVCEVYGWGVSYRPVVCVVLFFHYPKAWIYVCGVHNNSTILAVRVGWVSERVSVG